MHSTYPHPPVSLSERSVHIMILLHMFALKCKPFKWFATTSSLMLTIIYKHIHIDRVGSTAIQYVACACSWSRKPVLWEVCLLLFYVLATSKVIAGRGIVGGDRTGKSCFYSSIWTHTFCQLWASMLTSKLSRLPDAITLSTPTSLYGILPEKPVHNIYIISLYIYLSILGYRDMSTHVHVYNRIYIII